MRRNDWRGGILADRRMLAKHFREGPGSRKPAVNLPAPMHSCASRPLPVRRCFHVILRPPLSADPPEPAMNIAILDDYQDAVRTLECFNKLAGHSVTIHHDTLADEVALARRLAETEAVVLIRERTRLPGTLLERLPRLKIVSQTGHAGGGHIDVETCTRRGIIVCQGSGSPVAPAELTFGLILAAMRHIALEDRRLREGRWQTTLGRALKGLTLGIYGYGKIGALVAGYGKAFGMRVTAFGREASARRALADGVEVVASRERLFAESDVLSLHLRLSPETRGIVTREDLARMKPDALLVNTSRAELIGPRALEAALVAGRPGFAAVDVFESEPVLGGDHQLLKMDNVTVTPHLGYVEKSNYEAYFGTAFDNILAIAAGKPVNVVNPEVLQKRQE
jgi:D-3-phosphoglycerate dehydrogenase